MADLYVVNSVVIVAVMLFALTVVVEGAFRIGRRQSAKLNESSRSQVLILQSAVLGLLGLLLAFAFSMALQRFDSRGDAVIKEANAIGTAWLRAKFLPQEVRAPVENTLREYLNLRIRAGSINLAEHRDRQTLLNSAAAAQGELWRLTERAVAINSDPVRTGLFVSALNDMIDAFGSHVDAFERHVPTMVLLVLFAGILLTASVVGYASGLTARRMTFATYTMMGLVVLVLYIIVDLDRPRRGLIQVSHKSFTDLQVSLDHGASARPQSK